MSFSHRSPSSAVPIPSTNPTAPPCPPPISAYISPQHIESNKTMAPAENGAQPVSSSSPAAADSSSNSIVDAMEKAQLQAPQSSEETLPDPSRPFILYTRSQALLLSKSPLVKPPDGMPALKEWFGYVMTFLVFTTQCSSKL